MAWGAVLPIIPRQPNAYTGSPLDRAAHLRADADWIDRALSSNEAAWAPVWRGRSLIRDGIAVLLDGVVGTRLRHLGGPWAFLGQLQDRPVFAIDLSELDDATSLLPSDVGSFVDLRHAFAGLPGADAAILSHARGLMHWRLRHRFCGQCGTEMRPQSAGHVMLCPGCGSQHFPRTDPAVIMLVIAGDRALVAHSQRFPTPTMYSTLAGFVEPGESLEEAVARETFEETGVRVGQVLYHSSQPWPFPASLMVGFYAEAASEALVLDRDEIEDARWVTRDDIRDCEARGFSIPRGDSIARRLIEDWLES